ncbi:helix-turn-helix domain-containing protein [Paenibacillus sp. FSL R10-2736]|uniref:helix-turn-helix domain-containing protein n=1 Tax=Paenibacillus sp. FSL R10-2736 TaxID=2954692 RepID=UPI0030F9C2C9
MEPAATIRDQLVDYLSKHELSINQFAIRSGINSGTLSRIINGHQPIAMSHLELITAGMGVREDYFYSLYVDECFYHSAPTWRRLRPFIVKCAELGRMDCIELLVHNLLDNLTYVPMLFEVAEGLFQQGHWPGAALLYENVSASEKYQYSERLAMCQYRLFQIALGDDQSTNLRAATLFESYIPRLDEADQLDALKQLVVVYYSLRQWKKVDELAQELLRLATIQYDYLGHSKRTNVPEKKAIYPVYYYILYSHLMRSCACVEWEDYDNALNLIKLYIDGSWIREDSEETRKILAQFKEWGQANTYLYRLLAGQQEVIPEYVEYISTQSNEIFMALYRIIQSANRYLWNVDHVLDRFSNYVLNKTDLKELGTHNPQVIADQYARFLIELATYYLDNNRSGGVKLILLSLESSTKINSESIVMKCVDLFEQHRHEAEKEEKEQYKLLIRKVMDENEKKTHYAVSFV